MAWFGRAGNRFGSAPAVLSVIMIGSMLFGGCGKEDGAEKVKGTDFNQKQQVEADLADVLPGHEEPESSKEQTIIEETDTVLEENSLAEWEASLAEGDPEEFTAEAMRGVSVVRDGTPCFAVSYEPRVYKNSFDCWAISVPYQSMAVVDTEAMYAYFRVLEKMELTPVEHITEKQAGIEDSSDTVFVAYYSAQTAEGGQAEPDRGIRFRFGGEDENGNRYVESGGRLWSADGSSVEEIFGVDPYGCVLKVASVVSVETVSKVTIEVGEERYEMTVQPGVFRLGEKAVERADFYALYTDLMSVFIEKELPREEGEGVETGSAEQELLMSIAFERNMKQAPGIVQRYYAYDEEYATVQVNGTAFFLVSRKALVQLQERLEEAFK